MEPILFCKEEMKTKTLTQDKFFLHKALAFVPGLVAILRHQDLKIVYINGLFRRYLDYSIEDIENEDCIFTDWIEQQQAKRFLYQLNEVSYSVDESSNYVIYKIKNKSGKYIPFYLYASAWEPEENNQEKFYCIIMHPDLSKWGMPFTTFNTKDMFMEQFNTEDFGTFEWIINEDRIYCSDSLYKIYELDHTRREMNNAFARAFIHPGDKLRVWETTRAAIEKEINVNIEFKIVTAKSSIKIIHYVGKVIANHNGIPEKLVGSIRDVTQSRSIEENLKNKVDELYHSNKELEEFAFVASHDMQEPLRKIITFSSMLMEKYKEQIAGDGAMYLSRMTIAAENMRNLINDLLDFSRISKTKQPFEQIDLNLILRQVKTELELIIEETGTNFKIISLPEIDAIPSQMKQLFSNIINNAIKFRKAGITPEITIDTELLSQKAKLPYKLPKNEAYYKIKVCDNGIGFDEEYAERIFKVFQRLHGKSEYPGSGIGLAICKKILEHHNGIIYAENIPHKGACFIFIIPKSQKRSVNEPAK